MKLFDQTLFYLSSDHPYIVLELAIHGNLRDFLRNRRPPGLNYWADERTINSSYVIVKNSNDFKEILSDSRIRQQRVELLKFALDIANALLYFETLSVSLNDIDCQLMFLLTLIIIQLPIVSYFPWRS
ncbi:unnamed protein product [Schistosoma mattheei]|uniref:Uncharacterized protein n=1 Tax=Schistosoma mattheei TaxID=31246 RepID=A0A183Q1H0_9TREM|nr:unnamed protein product [Schistosoma mattheei]